MLSYSCFFPLFGLHLTDTLEGSFFLQKVHTGSEIEWEPPDQCKSWSAYSLERELWLCQCMDSGFQQ